MRRVLVTGSRARTNTATIPDALATVWGGGIAVLASGACPTDADPIAETIRTLTPDLHGGLCAGHPYPSLWDAELDGVCESTARRTRRHCVAQTICRRCPIMAACLASRTANPQLGGGVWGGEVFQEKESTAGRPAPSKPVATDPVGTTRKQPAPTGSCRHCHAPLTEQQVRRRGTECLACWRQPPPGLPQPGDAARGATAAQAYPPPVSKTRASESPVHGPARVVLPDARAGRRPDACGAGQCGPELSIRFDERDTVRRGRESIDGLVNSLRAGHWPGTPPLQR
jgi:hypothetical protein